MVWGFCSWGWGLVRDGLGGKPGQTAEGHRGQGAGRLPASRRQTCLLRPTKKPRGPWSDARGLGEVRPDALSDVSDRHQDTKIKWCLDPKQEQQRNRQKWVRDCGFVIPAACFEIFKYRWMTTTVSPRVSLPVSLEGKSDCITSLLQNLRWLPVALALSVRAALSHLCFLQETNPLLSLGLACSIPSAWWMLFVPFLPNNTVYSFGFNIDITGLRASPLCSPSILGFSDYRHITLLCLCFHSSPLGFFNLGTIVFWLWVLPCCEGYLAHYRCLEVFLTSTHQMPAALPQSSVVTTILHHLMIQCRCWSSSHHIHIPGNRREREDAAKGLS